MLVTGGSGFIGSALVNRLLAEGVAVRVADLAPFPSGTVACVTGDLRRSEVLEEALTPGTDAVIHLAALTSVLESVKAPEDVYRTNLDMSAALLERCRALGVPSLVMASTNAVVGAGLVAAREDGAGRRPGTGRAAIDETSPLLPLTPYGATKAAAEMLMSAYAACYGMSACAVRLTNVYGPGMANKDSIVPRLMRATLSGSAVQIYGDGLQVRDYLHVDDAVAAFVLAWRQGLSGPLTIGSGRSTSVLDLVGATREATGRPLVAEHVPPRQGEMGAVVVDIGRARHLGWEPRVGLPEGLAGAWDDFRHREG